MTDLTNAPSRRLFLATGPAAAVFAALGAAVASEGVLKSDPALVALAEWRRAKERADAALETLSVAERAYFAARPNPCSVTLVGREYRTLEAFDAAHRHGSYAGSEAVRAKREELARIAAERAKADALAGYSVADAASDEARDAEMDAEEVVLASEPTTAASAFAVLRFIASFVDVNGANEESTLIGDAMRRALAVLERGALA